MPQDPARNDAWLKAVLERTRSIAVVGLSDKPGRPSFDVTSYLVRSGYQCWGINPNLPGDAVEGVPMLPTLADLPGPVDMVDVFRNSAAAGDVVDEVLALPWKPAVIWMQLGVVNDAAAARAEAAGIAVVMDRCPAIERPRLIGRG